MASVAFLTYLIFCFCVAFVQADECVTYDFENDVDCLFVNDKGMCAERVYLSWSAGSYYNIEINSPHTNSASFMSAPVTLGCASTFDFTMTGSGTITTAPSGIIEAKVYLDFNSTIGYIMMNAMIVRPDGKDVSVAEAFVASYDANFVSGWQTLRIERIGHFGTNPGYVTFLGRGGANSLILLDSFRYIPPDMDEESCLVYKESLETAAATITEPSIENTAATITETTAAIITEPTAETTAATITETTVATITEPATETTTATITETIIEPTTTETQYTTTEQSDNIKKCVTYNFESDYNVLFSTENYFCNGFLPWQQENYTAIGIKSPYPGSTLFITPHDVISCISSIVFKMDPGGTIEAKVFMEPVQDMDHIIIQAYRVTDKEHDTVAGFKMYYQDSEVFVFGWNMIRFTLLDISTFDGYIVFIGSADKNSTVLVDSVRYIPPRTPSEHASCNLY